MVGEKRSIFDYLLYLFFGIIAVMMIYPLWNIFVISVVDYKYFAENPGIIIPYKLDFSAYKFIFASSEIINSLFISVLVTVFGCFYNLFLTLTLAYGLSMKRLPGRKIIISFVLLPFFFSGGIVPFYLLVSQMKMINTLYALIIPFGINIWYLIIIKNYFEDVPTSMRESAIIDGANDITIFLKIVLPLSKAMVATFTLFYAVERWNDWFSGMLFLNKSNLFPLQLLLRNIVFNNFGAGNMASSYRQMTSDYISAEPVKMATAFVAIVPILVIYPFLQKYFIKGVMSGAIKG